MRLDFLIRRRGVDPAAESALHALRDLMHAPVERVERGTLWRFDVDERADPAAVRDGLERAACRAGRYVNTNRDVCAWIDAASMHAGEASAPGCAVSLWITRGGGDDAVARDYFQGRVSAPVNRVRRGTYYKVWTAEVNADKALELVQAVAVARTRRHGLLLNPHQERLEVLSVTHGADTAEAR